MSRPTQRTRRRRVIFAWMLLCGAAIGWPVSALWLARHEPQFILALSWLAISLTAYDILATSQVHEEQGDDSPGKGV